MSDEIKKAQAEAQQMAKELGIYEILRNIATNGSNHSEPSESKWGSCLIKYKVKEMGLGHLVNNDNSVGSISLGFINAMSSAFTEQIVTSIAMPDGTILYRSVEVQSTGGQKVLDFRYGSWVEKLKTDSEKITADKQRAEAEKAEQEKRAKLSPFSAISDDEFEKGFNHISS